MSMSADWDDEIQDEVLRRVVGELRRPVRLDPEVDRRALAQIRAESGPWAGSPALRGWGTWLAGAAVAAGVMLAVTLPDRQQSVPEPAGAVAVRADETLPEVRPIRLRLAAPASSRVAVVGDFNDWDPAATPLRPGAGGTWVVELRLKPGRYHYTFLVDGRRWERDPSEPRAPESDFGAPVSVLTVS
jgi:hypothetical protein